MTTRRAFTAIAASGVLAVTLAACGGGSTSSPSRCPSAVPGGDAPGNPRPGNTAESGGEPTSPASPRWRRPARASSNETEFECTSDAPLLPVCPREWLRAERLDAPAEPDGLREE